MPSGANTNMREPVVKEKMAILKVMLIILLYNFQTSELSTNNITGDISLISMSAAYD